MSEFSAFDHLCMAEALRLAERGLWTTRPNPRVGCVIAKDAQMVGRGWHRYAGEPHAEVFALRAAGTRARGATAYVTLEPCAHHGRTPPCAEALVDAAVARVVIAARDPFPEVDGRGIERLRAAGILVEVGLCASAARELNVGFFSRIELGRPFVRLKLATSLDGRTALASGESKWITGAAARADVQRWRARACAILTSSSTVRADDPALTVRVDAPCAPPLRVVCVGAGGIPAHARLLNDGAAPVLLAYCEDRRLACPGGVETLALPAAAGGVALAPLLHRLAARGINEVHTECGPRLAGALWRAGLADEILLYQAPLLLGDEGRGLFGALGIDRMDDRYELRCLDAVRVGEDLRLRLCRSE